MTWLYTRLGVLAFLAVALSGCAGLEFEDVEPDDPYEDTGEIMKPGPGLFSGNDGTWTIFSF